MTRNTHSGSNERGAALVEYALLVALIAVVLIVSINFLGGKLGTTFAQASTEVGSTSALAASDTTGSGGTSGSGSAAGSGTTTTTNAVATTTSLPAATTTTTSLPTTTTTVAVTTTTTMAASGSGSGPVQGSTPDQSRTAAYKGEFQITFGASGDTISVTGVDAGDWTYEIVSNTDKKLKVKFTSADGDDVVLVEAKIKKNGKLKTEVETLK